MKKFMKIFIGFLSFIPIIILLLSTSSQVSYLSIDIPRGGEEDWNNNYGNTGTDGAYSIILTNDNCYALTGWYSNVTLGKQQGFILKLNTSGNQVWNITFGQNDEWGSELVQTVDDGYAVAVNNLTKAYLLKTDASGSIEWSKPLIPSHSISPYCIIQTSDGGYALAGYTSSMENGSQFWLGKTNSTGDIEWNATYGGSYDEIMTFSGCLIQTSDGGYALGGYTNSLGNFQMYFVKTNSNGVMEWNQTYGGVNTEKCYGITNTSDGGFALIGTTTSYSDGGTGDPDFYLVKTFANGTMEWNKTYGSLDDDEYGFQVIEVSNVNLAFTGQSSTSGGDIGCVVVTTSTGDQLWNQTYGVSGYNAYFFDLIETADNGFIMTGESTNNGQDIWVVKTQANTAIPEFPRINSHVVIIVGTSVVLIGFVKYHSWREQKKT